MSRLENERTHFKWNYISVRLPLDPSLYLHTIFSRALSKKNMKGDLFSLKSHLGVDCHTSSSLLIQQTAL